MQIVRFLVSIPLLKLGEHLNFVCVQKALGIVRWNGDVDFCITIRTLRVTDHDVSVQAGAGIVYDSVAEREYEETLHKARALMKVVDECANSD